MKGENFQPKSGFLQWKKSKRTRKYGQQSSELHFQYRITTAQDEFQKINQPKMHAIEN